jgi:hypothetical protein
VFIDEEENLGVAGHRDRRQGFEQVKPVCPIGKVAARQLANNPGMHIDEFRIEKRDKPAVGRPEVVDPNRGIDKNQRPLSS